MTGFGIFSKRLKTSNILLADSNAFMGEVNSKAVRSAPALKAFPPSPEMTTTLTAPSLARSAADGLQLVHHLRGDGVVPVRPVQRDPGERGRLPEEDLFQLGLFRAVVIKTSARRRAEVAQLLHLHEERVRAYASPCAACFSAEGRDHPVDPPRVGELENPLGEAQPELDGGVEVLLGADPVPQ